MNPPLAFRPTTSSPPRRWLFVPGRRVAQVLAPGLLLPAALAEPELAVDPVVLHPGGSAELVLHLAGGTEPYAGFNACLALPRGVRAGPVLPGSLATSPAFHLSWSLQDSGPLPLLRVAGWTSSASFGPGGILATVRLTADPDLATGVYPLAFVAPPGDPPLNAAHALASATGSRSVAHGIRTATLTVVLPATPGDTNGNGIDDAWERVHFGVVSPVGPSQVTDADEDGISDYHEYLAGTDPRDPASNLAIYSVGYAPSGHFELQWFSTANAGYAVDRATGIDGDQPVWMEVAPFIQGTPPLNSYSERVLPGTSGALYRIRRQ